MSFNCPVCSQQYPTEQKKNSCSKLPKPNLIFKMGDRVRAFSYLGTSSWVPATVLKAYYEPGLHIPMFLVRFQSNNKDKWEARVSLDSIKPIRERTN